MRVARFGFWNAGTPLLITSTPVSAEQPRDARNASEHREIPLIGCLPQVRTGSRSQRHARPNIVGSRR